MNKDFYVQVSSNSFLFSPYLAIEQSLSLCTLLYLSMTLLLQETHFLCSILSLLMSQIQGYYLLQMQANLLSLQHAMNRHNQTIR